MLSLIITVKRRPFDRQLEDKSAAVRAVLIVEEIGFVRPYLFCSDLNNAKCVLSHIRTIFWCSGTTYNEIESADKRFQFSTKLAGITTAVS